MPAFTIFNHGTNSHRSRSDGEIIAEFGRSASGTEYANFLITDGPGSASDAAAGVEGAKHKMPGKFDPYTRDKQAKSKEALQAAGFKGKAVSNPSFMDKNEPWRATGLVTGKGWDDNVVHSVAALAELNPPPSAVNMIGWSRGAVTCAKLAFKLAEIFPQVPVNIFAIDPVAGLGNKADEDASTLGPNVKNYLATLAMHEQRKGFEPQDLSRVKIRDRSATNFVFLPFPGKHNTEVRLANVPPEAAQAVWALAFRFLTNYGSAFNTAMSPRYTLPEFCNLYGNMRAKMPDYHALRQHVLTTARLEGGIGQRDFVQRMDQYVVDADYFINEHHRQCFLRAYPKAYAFLFEAHSTVSERDAFQDFRSMYNLTGLMLSLKPFGVEKPQPGHPFVLPPRGSGHKRGSTGALLVSGDMQAMGLF